MKGHMINYAKENELELCTNCSIGNPNRLSSGEDLGTFFAGKDIKALSDKEIADAIISKCIVDDSHGVLVTSIGKQNRNHARKSVIEFGWTIGIPNKNNTETYIHTKVVADAAGKEGKVLTKDKTFSIVLPTMVFMLLYAILTHTELGSTI